MDKKLLLVIICSFIVWLYYLSLGTIIGADSYYYLNIVCGITPNNDGNFLFAGLLNILPCSLIIIKLLYFGLWTATLIVVYKIGGLFDKKTAWWFPSILFAFTFFITEYWKFENDTIGFLLAFIGFYYLLKITLNTKWTTKIWEHKEFWLGVISFSIAGLFWKGTIYWIYSLVFLNIIFVPIVILALLVFGPSSLWIFSASQEVYEQLPFISIIFFGVSIFFLYGVLKNNYKINLMLVYLLMPAIMINKLFVLPILFLTITCFNGLKILRKNEVVNQTLIIFVCLMTLFWCVNLSYQFPQQQDIDLIQQGIILDNNLENTFGAGYIIEFYGGTPSDKSSYDGEITKKGIVIDVIDQNNFDNCKIINTTRYLLLEVCE